MVSTTVYPTCGVSTVFGTPSQPVIRRQRFTIEDVEARIDAALLQCRSQRVLIDQRPARGLLMSTAPGFMRSISAAADDVPACAVTAPGGR